MRLTVVIAVALVMVGCASPGPRTDAELEAMSPDERVASLSRDLGLAASARDRGVLLSRYLAHAPCQVEVVRLRREFFLDAIDRTDDQEARSWMEKEITVASEYIDDLTKKLQPKPARDK